ncbi:DUF948 domain-containing protein [Heyndrickxia vini]|uniref:DUF948 domain-containing protein n=1 Tax=Heyndrickxia vini TaxID=1476025 RepID=A0ABX7E4S0_9BACI|nr:DUF948 domain-containing protein [Heyndrickxia vini]QQZ10581.1 DUF948 domain-containing protein [Heyndrickxia vini]
MIIILYLSVALIAVAFLILVISVSKTLNSVKETLNQVSKTMEGIEGQMQGITGETTMLLHKTNALAEDIQQKSEKLNTVVYAVQDVGTTIKSLNESVRRVTNNVTHQVEKNQDKMTQVIQWSNVFKEIKDKWAENKEKKLIKQSIKNNSENESQLREVRRARS